MGTTTAGGGEQSGRLAIFMLLTSEESSIVDSVLNPEERGARRGAGLGGLGSVPIGEEYE